MLQKPHQTLTTPWQLLRYIVGHILQFWFYLSIYFSIQERQQQIVVLRRISSPLWPIVSCDGWIHVKCHTAPFCFAFRYISYLPTTTRSIGYRLKSAGPSGLGPARQSRTNVGHLRSPQRCNILLGVPTTLCCFLFLTATSLDRVLLASFLMPPRCTLRVQLVQLTSVDRQEAIEWATCCFLQNVALTTESQRGDNSASGGSSVVKLEEPNKNNGVCFVASNGRV